MVDGEPEPEKNAEDAGQDFSGPASQLEAPRLGAADAEMSVVSTED
jgi:hypothetical protein